MKVKSVYTPNHVFFVEYIGINPSEHIKGELYDMGVQWYEISDFHVYNLGNNEYFGIIKMKGHEEIDIWEEKNIYSTSHLVEARKIRDIWNTEHSKILNKLNNL